MQSARRWRVIIQHREKSGRSPRQVTDGGSPNMDDLRRQLKRRRSMSDHHFGLVYLFTYFDTCEKESKSVLSVTGVKIWPKESCYCKTRCNAVENITWKSPRFPFACLPLNCTLPLSSSTSADALLFAQTLLRAANLLLSRLIASNTPKCLFYLQNDILRSTRHSLYSGCDIPK